MARIVVNTWGSFGDVFPYVGLALALRERGHEPVLAMPALYREVIAREGLLFEPVGPDIDVDDRALTARVMDPARGPEVLFRQILVPALREAHQELSRVAEGAHLLVTHPAALAGPIVAEERRIPWASTVLAPMSLFSTSDPVVPPAAPWVYPLLARSRAASRAFVWLARQITRRWLAPVERFRASRGLPARGNPIMEGQHAPHLGLAMFSRVLGEPQPDWPEQTVVTGPILYNATAQVTVPDDLREFLDDGDPPIVFTLGTSAVGAAGAFYETSAAAAERLGRRAVLLVGPYPDNRPRRASRAVFAAEFAPHAALFPRACAIVHQGGVGTLHQALASGAPMIVVPHSHDQPDNARRAASLGVSRTVCPGRYRVATLARELDALLASGAYRERARRVAAVVKAENGPARACDAIEALLASSRP